MAATKPKYPAPTTLSTRGRTIWRTITSKYELRPDELITLEDYCILADEIATLRAEHKKLGSPLMTKGSMGQLVEHPIPKRVTDLRMKRNALAKQLNLPDDPAGEGFQVNQQRDAANTKWATGRGRGA